MNKIHAYARFILKLIPNTEDLYCIEVVDKIYNHEILNRIFENENIRVKKIEAPYNLQHLTQFVIFIQEEEIETVLCILNLTNWSGEIFNQDFIYDTDAAEFTECEIGYGHFGKNFNDAVLFKQTDALFEIYIFKGCRSRQSILFERLANGQLEQQIKLFTNVMACFRSSGYFGVLPDISPFKDIFPDPDDCLIHYNEYNSELDYIHFIKKISVKVDEQD